MKNFRTVMIIALTIGAVIAILVGIWKSGNPQPFSREICTEPSRRKLTNDSIFSSTEFEGLVVGIKDRIFTDRPNVTFVHLKGLADSRFSGYYKERRFFDLRNSQFFRLGFFKLMASRLELGDTIIKQTDSKYFSVKKINGTILRCELECPGYCEGTDCAFRRINGMLCYTLTEED